MTVYMIATERGRAEKTLTRPLLFSWSAPVGRGLAGFTAAKVQSVS